MSNDLLGDALAGIGAGVAAYGLLELAKEPSSTRTVIEYEPVEIYACEECGGLFVTGYGPDNILESAGDDSEAHRDGECPACGAEEPDMEHVTTHYSKTRRGRNGTADGEQE